MPEVCAGLLVRIFGIAAWIAKTYIATACIATACIATAGQIDPGPISPSSPSDPVVSMPAGAAVPISSPAPDLISDKTYAEISALNRRDVLFLVAHPSADNLAVAAWLSRFAAPGKAAGEQQVLELIEKAEALAPAQPDLVWMHVAICQIQYCEKVEQLESHLKDVDSNNGFAWVPDLERATAAGADTDITAVLERMGAGSLTTYWNRRVVMIADAMAAANPHLAVAERGLTAFGMASSMPLFPFQSITRACKAEKLPDSRRKSACERLMARMEVSDTIIAQSLALSVQERWWPAGSPELAALKAKHRKLDYLILTSSRLRLFRLNHDMARRIEAARRYGSEEDVARSMVNAFGYPEDPPERWKDTLRPG